MLKRDVERYIGLRHAMGFKFEREAANLRGFASFATARGDAYVKAALPSRGQRQDVLWISVPGVWARSCDLQNI